ENFVNMRTQFARLRVDDGELLFDSQSERVVFHAMMAERMSLENNALSSRAQSGNPLRNLTARSRDFSTPLRSAQNDRPPHTSSPNERRVTAACRNLPQLRLSRPATCSRALRMAISQTASTTHSKLCSPIHAASQSGAGLQKSIATGTPSRIANSTVLRSEPRKLF